MLFFTGMGGIALSLSGLQGDALSYKKAVMNNAIDGIVLFSGGLDSILASRVLMEQGLSVRCLHFVSPFFGSLHSAERWKRLYGVDVVIADASQPIVDLVNGWPPHGFGKVMNPCVDCKITLLRMARAYMEKVGAKFLATGEVVGQRPMSQRCDVMNTIRREAGVDGILLRPLCAHHLDPTPMELSGLVDRSKLLGIHGRGRQEQLALAKEFGFTEIPTPGGGCWLAERENARRYWPIRTRYQVPALWDGWDELVTLPQAIYGVRMKDGTQSLCVPGTSGFEDQEKMIYFVESDMFDTILDPSQVESLLFFKDWQRDAEGKPTVEEFYEIPVK